MKFFRGSASSTSSTSSTNAASKRGEINELHQILTQISTDAQSDDSERREALQKVIAYTTMGFDTSKLFNRMIMFVHTRDVIQKKMVYQYITHYAPLHSELAILAINTLSNDCRDDSPLVRGLALRHLASLRGVSKLQDYLLPLIKEGLNDPSPYVRKTAVLAIVKLRKISPKAIEKESFVDRLYAMIRDQNIQVVVNCIHALNELLREEGGIKTPKKMVFFLLNRLKEFNEWQLGTLLELLLRYTPKDKKEVFGVMNLLDDRLQLSNAHVILGITNVFLQYSENLPKIHNKVYMRLKEPLLLLLASESSEMQYSILKHLKIMIQRCPQVFQSNYQEFFINYNDPTFVAEAKLELLVLCATPQNVKVIMDELSYYVSLNNTPEDAKVARASIRALGAMAVRVSAATEVSLSHLLDFLEMGLIHIISETFVVLKDILRKYRNPDFCAIYLPQIIKHWKLIEDNDSRVAFIWLLGEFGDEKYIKEAPYILENFINKFTTYDYSVRLEVLTSAMKLFFARPPEMQKMLGRLFVIAISDASHADVHDKALFYYRLLRNDISTAKQVVYGKKSLITEFAEEESEEYRDRLFSEFNTFSVLYEKPSETFIVNTAAILGSNEEEYTSDEDVATTERSLQNETSRDDVSSKVDDEMENQMLNQPSIDESTTSSSLLNFDESNFSKKDQSSTRALLPIPRVLEPQEFEVRWSEIGRGLQVSLPRLFKHGQPPAELVEQSVQKRGFICIALSEGNPSTFYFYAQRKDSSYILMEVKIDNKGNLTAELKQDSKNMEMLEQFKKTFQDIFSSIEG